MNLDLKEQLFAENKIGQPKTASWDWDMTRTIAALYNSGGGVLRVGVDDNGVPARVHDPLDYTADKSPLTALLNKYLENAPPFAPSVDQTHGYVTITVKEGVTSPSILRCELQNPYTKKSYAQGTVFIRRMNGSQPSSEPPQTRSDWQTVLHLWEANRGVTLLAPVLKDFCLILNEWNPFDRENTSKAIWRANCIADVAATLGRERLRSGLKAIIEKMKPTPYPYPPPNNANQAGADYKQPRLDEVIRLCVDLGLTTASAKP